MQMRVDGLTIFGVTDVKIETDEESQLVTILIHGEGFKYPIRIRAYGDDVVPEVTQVIRTGGDDEKEGD